MQLYFSPGACSLSPHIVLREAALAFELAKVDLKTHRTEDGVDFYTINPKGQVPTLKLDDGSCLTEGPVIAQFIADQAPQSNLLPAAGSMERYRVIEWQNYITSELHKSFSPLFNSQFDTAAKAVVHSLLRKKYEWLNIQLAQQKYLMGDAFTIADAYLFAVTRWAAQVKLPIEDLANVQNYLQRIQARPAVSAAMQAEGLL
jgi:glutathione S-transferase